MWAYEESKLVDLTVDEVSELKYTFISHEYVFRITAQTYLAFPVTKDTKTIIGGIKFSILPGKVKPFKVM